MRLQRKAALISGAELVIGGDRLAQVPATTEVIRTLEIEPRDNQSSQFRCSVEVRLPALLTLLSTLTFLQSFLRWHMEGETPLFAANLGRKVADGHLAPP